MKTDPDGSGYLYTGYNDGLVNVDVGSKATFDMSGSVKIFVDVSWYTGMPPKMFPSEIRNKSILESKRYTDFKLLSKDEKEFPCHKDIIIGNKQKPNFKL